MTRTFELIQTIIDEMPLTIHATRREGNKFFTDNTLYLQEAMGVMDKNGTEFAVFRVDFNNSVWIEVPLGTEFEGLEITLIKRPTFLQGKWMSANQEYLDMERMSSDKTPLIWLVRGYEERHFGRESSISFAVEPVIYFLNQADFNNWTNEDHDVEAINPMYNLAKYFISQVEKRSKIRPLKNWSIQDEPRFGVKYSNEKGNKKRILDDDLSGVGLRIPLEIIKC